MALLLTSLSKSFPSIYFGPNGGPETGFDYGSISAMITVEDTYNLGSTEPDVSFLDENAALANFHSPNGRISLFQEVSGEFLEIPNGYAPIATGCKIYVRRAGKDADDPNSYVNVYDLMHVSFGSPNARYNPDIGVRIGALLYAMASLRKKKLMLRLSDAQAINGEQEKVLKVFEEINAIVDSMRSADGSESDHSKWVKWSPGLGPISFLVERDLLGGFEKDGILSEKNLEDIRSYIKASSNPDDPKLAGLKEKADAIVAAIGIDRTQIAMLGDILRIYHDQLSGLLTEAASLIALELQYFQQDVTAATTLLARVENLFGDSIAKI
ncbi:MAG: hypothetical protein LBI39_01180 [Puniceicoccales bacterium]|jgi:hypothetical protein|nr:hypothetical protein [Puniceicoccales bacterium]